MAIDTKSLSQLIAEFRKLQAKDSITPESLGYILQTKGTVLLVYLWHMYGAHTVCKPKVTMFAVEMWFGVGDGVECGRSTGLCPLPLGVPRCVIHNKKNVGTKFLVILKKNKY